MAASRTEHADDRYAGLDAWPSGKILAAIATAQRGAIDAVSMAIPALAAAGEAIAERLRGGGRLVYAGAGSSGLLAKVDALELPGTYGIPEDRVPVLMAGGDASFLTLVNAAEDDTASAVEGVDALAVDGRDALVAVSASGRTPYAVAALRRARERGALTVGLASNAGAPLVAEADHGIVIATPPEVIAGSTRMNAGTAQKCALNMLSTLIGIRLGHGYEGLMVNVRADNEKLRGRAVGIVGKALGVATDRAAALLALAEGDIKAAILIGAGARDEAEAQEILESRGRDVRASLAALAERRGQAG
jgi:N-acetylmuramic acid 6-phosphate etherase